MVVGILQLELTIDGSHSLKDKRRVVRSLKDRLHREHQVSVAEVGDLELHNRAHLGIAMAGSSVPTCQSTLDRVLDKLRTGRDYVLTDHRTEIPTGH